MGVLPLDVKLEVGRVLEFGLEAVLFLKYPTAAKAAVGAPEKGGVAYFVG